MENPQDWKAAVDPTSGRTYWYHRKTRVSTWTKPNFYPDPNEPQQQQPASTVASTNAGATSTNSSVNALAAAGAAAVAAVSSGSSANMAYESNSARQQQQQQQTRSVVESSSSAMPSSRPQSASTTIYPSSTQTTQQQYQQQSTMSNKPLSVNNPDTLVNNYTTYNNTSNSSKSNTPTTANVNLTSPANSNDFRFIPSSLDDETMNIEKLKNLLHFISITIDDTTIRNIRKSPLIITDLCKYITSASSSTKTIVSRLYALQLLVRLSSVRILACTAFHSNQSWLALIGSVVASCGSSSNAKSVGSTNGNNKTLMLLLNGLIIQLLVGPTASLVPSTSLQLVQDELRSMLSTLANATAGNSNSNSTNSNLSWDDLHLLTNDYFIRLCSILVSKGHSLAGMIILVLAFQALSVEKIFTKLVKNGIVGAIQSVYVSPGMDEDLRATAKKCLQGYLNSSEYVRDLLLDSYLNMSQEMTQVAIPVGSSIPSIYSTVELEEGEETFQVMMESGCFDIADLTPGETLFNNSFGNRDIIWMPKSGASWKLNSIILWSRCPALRELIQDFWNQGGGSLELSIDASDEVVYSVCQFIHSGMVNLPIPRIYQLELLRVASELGMTLYQSLLESSIGHLVNIENVDEILEFCHSYGFDDLALICERYLEYHDHDNSMTTSGKYHPKPIRLMNPNSTVGNGGNVGVGNNNIHSPFSPSGNSSHHNNVNSTLALEHAVMQSLNDVGDLLNENTYSSTNNKRMTSAGASSYQTKPQASTTYGQGPTSYYGKEYDQTYPTTSTTTATVTGDGYGDDDDYDVNLREYLDGGKGGIGGGGQARGRTDSGDDYKSNRSSFDSESYSATMGGKKGATTTAGGKPKMGGIYSALLQGNKNSGGYDVSEPLPSKTAPGKKPSAGAKPDAKAAAKKSDHKSSAPMYDLDSSMNFDLDSSFNGGTGPMEFNRDMSLKPQKPKTEQEKRWEEMSKPRHLRENTKAAKKNAAAASQDDDKDSKLDGDGSMELPAASATGSKPVGKPAAGGTAKPKGAAPAATAATNNKATAGTSSNNAKSTGSTVPNATPATNNSGSVAPTIQVKTVHHPNLNQSQEPNCFSTEVGDGQESSNNGNNMPPTNAVRSSLTLLKNKTPKARRRASASAPALDDEMQQQQQEQQQPFQGKLNYGYGNDGYDDNDNDAFTPPNPSGGSRPGTASNATVRGGQQGSFNGRSQSSGGGVRNSYDDEQDMYMDQNNRFRGGSNQADSVNRSANNRSGNSGGFRGRQPEPEPEEDDDDEYADYGRGTGGGSSSYGYDDTPGAYPDIGEEDGGMGMEGPQEGFMECPDCGRHFAAEPFTKHVRICKKVFMNKRKVFDSSKKRIEGIPELKSILDSKKKGNKRQSLGATAASAGGAPKSNKWKEQSMAFREAMRAAREYANGGANSGGADVVTERKPYVDPSLIQCPNCQRRFNDKAAERHIPLCKNIIAKPSTLKKGAGSNASSQATTKSSSGVSGGTIKRGWN